MKIIKEMIPYFIVIVVVVIIRLYVITPVRVDGTSMIPTLNNNQILLLKKFDKKINRFDIIVLDYDYSRLIKRVVGLPGEHVKYVNNVLYINNKAVNEEFINDVTNDFDLLSLGVNSIPKGYYFVMGDNRSNSIDSRTIGLVNKNEILGTTSFSLFPFNRFGFIG